MIYNQKKKEKKMEKLIQMHLEGQLQLYMSNKIENENYDIYYSELIKDQYWNFAYLKNKELKINQEYPSIKKEFKKINRKPLLYLTTNQLTKKREEELKKENLKLYYTDVWMTIEDIDQWENKTSGIRVTIQKVEKEQREEFIKTVIDGFSGDNPEDPYESLEEGYKVALKESFEKENSEYKVNHYLGKYEKKPIATATVVYQKDKAILYNITTCREYQRRGVCRQMMTKIIQDLKTLKVKTICLQTEKGFNTEQIYKSMGFQEKFLGKAFGEK